MDFMSFISKEVLILVAVIYALGMMLKGTKKIADWLIPWILLGLALGFSFGMLGITVNAVIQAVLVTAAAVYTNQLLKQTVEGVTNKETPRAPQEIKPGGEVEYRK